MNTTEGRDSLLWWPNLIVLLVLAAGIISAPDPIDSTRPSGKSLGTQPAAHNQKGKVTPWVGAMGRRDVPCRRGH